MLMPIMVFLNMQKLLCNAYKFWDIYMNSIDWTYVAFFFFKTMILHHVPDDMQMTHKRSVEHVVRTEEEPCISSHV